MKHVRAALMVFQKVGVSYGGSTKGKCLAEKNGKSKTFKYSVVVVVCSVCFQFNRHYRCLL